MLLLLLCGIAFECEAQTYVQMLLLKPFLTENLHRPASVMAKEADVSSKSVKRCELVRSCQQCTEDGALCSFPETTQTAD